jgi:hypothetical protein
MMPTGIPAPRQSVSVPFKSIERLRMAKQSLTEDFKEFLTLLNDNGVEYLRCNKLAAARHKRSG